MHSLAVATGLVHDTCSDHGVCDFPPYEPTPEDRADYDRWIAERGDVGDSPDPAPGEPLLSFVETIRAQAAYYRSLETTFGDWFAAWTDRLADQAAYLEARGPAAFDDRRQAMLDSAAG